MVRNDQNEALGDENFIEDSKVNLADKGRGTKPSLSLDRRN